MGGHKGGGLGRGAVIINKTSMEWQEEVFITESTLGLKMKDVRWPGGHQMKILYLFIILNIWFSPRFYPVLPYMNKASEYETSWST